MSILDLKNPRPAAERSAAVSPIRNTAAPDIAAEERPPSGGVCLEVTDRGSGLSEQALRDALVPFFSTKSSGTGLGLTLCREIVEAHGGRLTIANRPDGGAVVAVHLP
jgi:signal transduction histidine kinase